MLVGDALLADLGALVERLSVAAGVRESDLAAPFGNRSTDAPRPRGQGRRPSRRPIAGRDHDESADALAGPWMDATALCARWRIGRKTLERLRKRGLIGRRVTGDRPGTKGGAIRQRLMFSQQVVEACEHAGLVSDSPARRAGKSSRVSAADSAKMRRWALEYRRRLGWSMTRSAERIAQRTGRSPGAVKRALGREQETQGVRRISERQRQLMSRAARLGVRPGRVAGRVGRSRASVYRLAAGERADRLRALELDSRNAGPIGAVFERPDAGEVLLGAACVQSGLTGAAPESVSGLLELAASMPPPDAETELARSAAYWFLRWRAARTISGLGGRTPKVAPIDRAETDLRWASRIKLELVRSQLATAMRTTIDALGRELASLPQSGDGGAGAVLGEALAATADAVDRFDPFKDWGSARLAAQTTIAVNRTVARWAGRHAPIAARSSSTEVGRAARLVRVEDTDHADVLIGWPLRLNPWQAWLEPAAAIRGRATTNPDAILLGRRFGWLNVPPMTTAELAAEFKTTATRISATERRLLSLLAGRAEAKAGGRRSSSRRGGGTPRA